MLDLAFQAFRWPRRGFQVAGGLSWAVFVGTGTQTLDLTGRFPDGATGWTIEPSGDDWTVSGGTLSINTNILGAADEGLNEFTVSAGGVSKTVRVTVGAFHPSRMFEAYPDWTGGYSDPNDASSLFADAADTTPIAGNDGDEIQSYRIGDLLFARYSSSLVRTYVNDSTSPPHMTIGMHVSDSALTLGPDVFFCAGHKAVTPVGNIFALSTNDGNFSTETNLGITPSLEVIAKFRTSSDGLVTLTSPTNFYAANEWQPIGVSVDGLDVELLAGANVYTTTLPSAMASTPELVYLGGYRRNSSSNNNIDTTGAAVYIFDACPDADLRLLIRNWVSVNSALPSARAYFLSDPSITPAAPTFSDTLTLDAGTAYATETPTVTREYYLDGADASGSVSGDEYTVPASSARQFVQVTTASNSYSPDTVHVSHVEIDQGSTPSGEDAAPTFTVSKYAHDGVLFSFSTSVSVGHFISGVGSGDVFVVDPGAGVDVTYTPGPAVTDDALPRQINGAMLNPGCDEAPGYDDYIGQYSAANNASLSTITMTAGDSLVVAVSDPDEDPTGKDTGTMLHFVVLTCVSTAPKWDAFRPPYTWPSSAGAKPSHRLSDVTFANLPSLSAEPGRPTAAEVADIRRRPVIDTEPNWNRDYLTTPGNGNRYGRNDLGQAADLIGFILSDATDADKRQGVINQVQCGIDRLGIVLDGQDRSVSPIFGSDGGHNNGRLFDLIMTGDLLGDASFAAAVGTNPNDFHEIGMTFYVDQSVVDATNGGSWAPQYEANGSDAYQQGMVDGGSYAMPEWRGNGSIADTSLNAHFTAHPYRVAGQNHDNAGQMIQVLYLLAAGLKATVNHDAFFDYQIRHWQIRLGNADPWRFQGGGTSLYDEVAGATSTTLSGWPYEMFAAHVMSFYSYPWAP